MKNPANTNVRPAIPALLALLLATPVLAQRISLPLSRERLEQLAAESPNDAAAHYNLGLGWWSEKKYDEAEASFLEATAIEPRFADPEFALAFLPFARDDDLWDAVFDVRDRDEEQQKILEDTDRRYRRAIMLDPLVDKKIMGAVLPKKNAYLAFDEFWSGLYDDWVRGYEDFQLGRYERAYERLSTIRENTMTNRSARSTAGIDTNRDLRGNRRSEDRLNEGILWFHGLAAAHVGDWEPAIEDFEILVERSLRQELVDSLVYAPLNTGDYQFILGVLHKEAGDDPKAIEYFTDALTRDLSLFMAHVHMANIFEAQRRFDRALEERQRAVNANPGDGSLLMELGLTQYRAGQRQEAARSLEQAQEVNPRDARPLYLLGLVRVALGDGDGAYQAFEQFVERAPARLGQQIQDARARLDAMKQ
ncbi:MAG: tetratricopeptide repeat protein [Gemmatimonadota bacterium]